MLLRYEICAATLRKCCCASVYVDMSPPTRVSRAIYDIYMQMPRGKEASKIATRQNEGVRAEDAGACYGEWCEERSAGPAQHPSARYIAMRYHSSTTAALPSRMPERDDADMPCFSRQVAEIHDIMFAGTITRV